MKQRKRQCAEKKQWFKCIGGPWDKQKLLLPSNSLSDIGITMIFSCKGYRGRYELFNPTCVKWKDK